MGGMYHVPCIFRTWNGLAEKCSIAHSHRAGCWRSRDYAEYGIWFVKWHGIRNPISNADFAGTQAVQLVVLLQTTYRISTLSLLHGLLSVCEATKLKGFFMLNLIFSG